MYVLFHRLHIGLVCILSTLPSSTFNFDLYSRCCIVFYCLQKGGKRIIADTLPNFAYSILAYIASQTARDCFAIPKKKYWQRSEIGGDAPRPNQLLPTQKPKIKTISKTIFRNDKLKYKLLEHYNL
jgi:hypothetical protein